MIQGINLCEHRCQYTDYGRHVDGIRWKDGRYRRVLTTRRDGMISIWQRPHDRTCYIDTAR